mmetsp:Transcript_9341/g.17931  ORF Transcript_9341/g.17931 Transcript_9341/m.17931 type:complete len:244 (-) Transcript_9341:5990-6721(-)
MKLEGKVVIVTGGASGIGASSTEYFASRGCKVVIWDFNESLGRAIAKATGAAFFQCDVASEQSVAAAYASTVELYPSIDILINCAGVFIPTFTLSSKRETEYANFQRLYSINVIGSFNCSRLVASNMIRKEPQGGVIILLSSMLAYQANYGQAAYGASKAALKGMAIAMARDLGAYNIRVNTVSPGPIDTPMLPSDKLRGLANQHSLVKRLGRTDDVVHVIAAAIENDYLTGGDLAVDGGMRL